MMCPPRMLLTCMTVLALGAAGHAEPRDWTSTSGTTLSAELVGFDGTTVTLRTGTRVVEVPVTQLGPDDQVYLRSWVPPAPAATPAAGAAPESGGSKKWPDTVDAPRSYEIQVISEDEAGRTFVYRSPHYEFTAPIPLSKTVMQEMAVVFEATYALLAQLPVGLNLRLSQTEPLKVLLVEDVAEVVKLGGNGSEAYYLSKIDSFVSTLGYLGARKQNGRWAFSGRDVDLSDVSLRIAQQLYGAIRPPTWFNMGFGKYIAIMRYKDGRFFVSSQRSELLDYLESRGHDGDVPMTNLERLMAMSTTEWNGLVSADRLGTNYETSVLLVYYFLHLDGAGDSAHVAEYVKALSERMPAGEAQEKFLVRGRSYAKLSEDVESSLRGEAIRVRVPRP